MNATKVIRVAVLGTPQAEQWLLTPAFKASQKREYVYEQVSDPSVQRPDFYVVDPDSDYALARWAALDPRGTVPAAFFTRVHVRAKCAVPVGAPLTSGRVIEALDQLARRFLQVNPAAVPAAQVVRPAAAPARALAAAAA